jgi:uncharacterized protein
MEYRTFPKIPDLKISSLGFGCMRLPILDRNPARINEEAATRLLHQAIDAGVNYIDTAWPYHMGESEPFVGRALKGERRRTVQLASKSPVWLVQTEGDWERFLDEQLKRLETDHLDFYLLHALSGVEQWETVRRLNGIQAMERARADGRIRHLGFSFHGSPAEFRKIIDGYAWEFCQIQFNYLDQEYQAGLAGLRYAREHRVGVVVMEPLRGGALSQAPPEAARIWARSSRSWSATEWALRWIWSHPEVVTVLSGMNAESQVDENARAAGNPEPLPAADLALVEEARNFYLSRVNVPCTTCGYCVPCPKGVAIPGVLSLYNDSAMFGSTKTPAWVYKYLFLSSNTGGDQCVQCGQCGPKCPQGIPIMETIGKAHARLIGGSD